ncbi:MAG: CRISPR-associated helicase Cas3' [Saprospiraceae bacterium]|nr:CRISPR-associated helicase Cas3' [Saprospiraceae bacterium]
MKKIPLAKSSGITLQEHTDNVVAQGNYIIESFPFTMQKYQNMVGKDLSKRLCGACKHHDDGKAHRKWQEACYEDYYKFLEWQQKYGGTFQDYDKAVKGKTGESLMKTGIRHEIYSLIKNKNDNFSLPVQVAIAAHHSKLSYKHQHRWEDGVLGIESTNFWKLFKNKSYEFKSRSDFQRIICAIYEYSGVRGLLQLADHRASAGENLEKLPAFKKFSYAFPHPEKRNVQKIIDEYWEEELLLVRAPTGAGKTDASLLWAAKQIENGKAERLIIAMPTRFTSNALSINVASSLSDTGLYHSSAWFAKFNQQVKEDKLIIKAAKKEHELARKLLTPVTVCTIDHLLIALSLTREDHHTIAFNLANSCVVIDEADFYDDFTQANILVLLEALRIWKVPVLIMSASLPESSVSMYQKTGYQVNYIKEDTSDNNRIRCQIQTIREYSEVAELEDLFHKCAEQKAGIIYANTVDKAFRIYSWFEKRDLKPILYHSRFTEPDKKNKEELLIKKLGKDAWQQQRAEGIAILTQIGELSINISADIMLTDLCPMDRFVQRAGRLSRFDKGKIGEIHLLHPIKDGSLYPAPYGIYQRGKGWTPIESLLKTKELLTTKGYSATDFVNLVNEVYPASVDFSDKAILNANSLKDYLIYNWLITPKESVLEDADEAVHWKSRNIQGNETVFVKRPDSIYFKNWTELNEFKCEYSVDLPLYLVEQGIKKFKLERVEIHIGDDKHFIVVAFPDVYSPDTGLVFKEDSLDDNFL